MALFDYIKQIFIILLIIQFTPSILRSIKRQYGDLFDSRTKVGTLAIKGVIFDSAYYTKELTRFFEDPEIKAILLKIECPGSAAGSGQLIYNEILSLKKANPKPVITKIENICTSGGFWIACASDHIITPGTALVGNIGATFAYLFQLKPFLQKHNIGYEDIKAGNFKSALNPFVSMTPEDKQLLQGVLDDTYQQFTQAVARARRVSMAKLDQWADGKIFTGQQALKLNLVDELGGPQQVIAAIKQKALIEGKIEWVRPRSKGGWFSSFFEDDEGERNMLSQCSSFLMQEARNQLTAHCIT